MRRGLCLCLVALTLTIASAQDGGVKSGPPVDAVLPSSFDAFVINGKTAAGRQHCLVCENALSPAVMVFVREPQDNRDPEAGVNPKVAALMTKLDEAMARHEEELLGGFVVFLSPDARSSATGSTGDDVDKLLDEARKRNALFARLKKVAEPLKSVVVAAHPDEGPKGYQLNPKAEVTVLLYQKLKVRASWAFEPGKMSDADVANILKKLDDTLGAKKGEPGA